MGKEAVVDVTEERRLVQQREQRLRTPPVEEQDSGPAIREMRAQLRSDRESGSRGARRVRKGGKVISKRLILITSPLATSAAHLVAALQDYYASAQNI